MLRAATGPCSAPTASSFRRVSESGAADCAGRHFCIRRLFGAGSYAPLKPVEISGVELLMICGGDRYASVFLHTEYFGRDTTRDEEGAIFDGLDAVEAEAVEGMRELLAAAVRDPEAAVPRRILIQDSAGNEVRTILAKDFIPPPLQQG